MQLQVQCDPSQLAHPNMLPEHQLPPQTMVRRFHLPQPFPGFVFVEDNALGVEGEKWVNLTQMTIISTTVGKNPLEEME